jgi:hypothetical protein
MRGEDGKGLKRSYLANLNRRDNVRDMGMIILKWALKEHDVRVYSWVLVLDPCEHPNEPSGFVGHREFIGRLSEYQLLRKAYASRSWYVCAIYA